MGKKVLVDLFSNYTVLFVGYSHNDPVMKYLATGLPPSTRRYAFVAQGKIRTTGSIWEYGRLYIRIKVIIINLVKAVKRWAELMGIIILQNECEFVT